MKLRRPDRGRTLSDGDFGPADFGPILAVLLSCLAITMVFTTLGLGFVNLSRESPVPTAALATISVSRRVALPPSTPVGGESSPLERELKEKKELESKLTRVEQQIHQLEEEKRKLALDQQGIGKSKATLDELQLRLQDLARQASERTRNVTQPDIERERSLAGANARLIAARRLIEDADGGARELRRRIQEKKTMFDPQLNAASGGGNPQWVECVRGAVILVPQGERISAERLKNDPSFTKAVSGRYVVFLVRPSGMDAFASARVAAEVSGASRLGYEPIDQSWQIKYR